MPLITVPEHTERDLGHWYMYSDRDRIYGKLLAFRKKPGQAIAAIQRFFSTDPKGYIGVSWGKDSVVVADLACIAQVDAPLVWIKVQPHYNPHCELVRDEFLRLWPRARYEEVEVESRCDADGWHTKGTLEAGFHQAVAKYGDRHVSGVRAGESGIRQLVMRKFGQATQRTCRPIGYWSDDDVFAYLSLRSLPIHPAYAMSFGGTLERGRLRVCSLGGESGTGFDRRRTENFYYAWRVEQLTRMWEERTGLRAGGRYVL
jgi:phosphoadenosine phosphosulfate reductase